MVIYKLDFTSGQAYQGGTMNYRIIRQNSDQIQIRYFHKFLQISASLRANKSCSGDCLSTLIDSEEIRYNRFNGSRNETEKFNGSFYCDSYIGREQIVIGSRESDVVLNKKLNGYEFDYAECCVYDDIRAISGYYKHAKFALSANLKTRNDTGEINNIPDTRNVSIYIEMKLGLNNPFRMDFADIDGDQVRCEWSSSTCIMTGGCTTFELLPNCTLRLLRSVSPQKFSLAILVKDFPKNATDFREPLSTVPFYMVVNVLSEVASANPVFECPSNRTKTVLNVSTFTSHSNSVEQSFVIVLSILFLALSNFVF